MDGTYHSDDLWLFSLTKDLNASEICNMKAEISPPVFFMMYSEYLIGFQCNYLTECSVNKIVFTKFPCGSTAGSLFF